MWMRYIIVRTIFATGKESYLSWPSPERQWTEDVKEAYVFNFQADAVSELTSGPYGETVVRYIGLGEMI